MVAILAATSLKANHSCIQKVKFAEFSDVREMIIDETLRQFGEDEDMLFHERFTDEVVVLIVNTKTRFVCDSDYRAYP